MLSSKIAFSVKIHTDLIPVHYRILCDDYAVFVDDGARVLWRAGDDADVVVRSHAVVEKINGYNLKARPSANNGGGLLLSAS